MFDFDINEKILFWQNGYFIVRNVFTEDEMRIVKNKILSINEMNDRVNLIRNMILNKEHPSFSTIFVWNDTDGNDIFAKIGKSPKILDRMSNIFDDDIYCYHNKIALKYPGIVGFNPHQDYNYWNKMGV